MKRILALVIGYLCFCPVTAQNAGRHTGQRIDAKPSPTETDRKIKRWFEFDQLSLSTRYHFIANENKRKAANSLQWQFIAKFRLHFDPKGRYSLVAGIGPRTGFTSGWENTGIGTGKLNTGVTARQLYFDAKPTEKLEVQIGGLYVNLGENTEAVAYDNDNFILGERIQLRHPKKVYFDEISVTSASLRDLNTPTVFLRLKHFGRQNYHQFLVRKQVNKTIGFSADYTFHSGIDILHQAVRLKIPPKHLIDTFLFEQYEILDPRSDYGSNVFADKRLDKRLTIGGGFVRTSLHPLNADRFPPGKRIYFNAAMKLSPEISLMVQATEGVGFIQPTIARTRVNVFLTYNILESLKKTKYF